MTSRTLHPDAFDAADHIETLYELDQEIIGEANEPGLKRAESLNANPKFIKALADLAAEHLQKGEKCSKQMLLRCPMCVNERCRASKEFFEGQQL